MAGKAVSLFSGCGGFCEGMKLAGFDIKVAVEIDPHAVQTYRYNFPNTPMLQGDVADFATPDSGHQIAFGLRDVDVVFGGPPCQGYSQIGTRDLNDTRNSLYKEFARVVDTLRPKIFLMENVPNILLLNNGHFKELISRKFRDIGYSRLAILKVSAADFGVPQARNRVIFLGVRDGETVISSLEEICAVALQAAKVTKSVSVRDALYDLPDQIVESGRTLRYPNKPKKVSEFQRVMRLDYDTALYGKSDKQLHGLASELLLHNHHTKEILARRARLISYLKPGEKADSLPKHIWNGARPEKWRRLHPDQPAYTILAQMHRDMSEWVHPRLDRWITVREAARLQSFHDGFVFRSSEWQQLKQIGNAVPPLLAYALGNVAQRVLASLKSGRKSASQQHRSYSIAAE
jgi:DNA (cytosine-5)-methyltransferase 1